MSNHDMRHMEFLEVVTRGDVQVLREKEATYQGSWKAAGGRSAWFMLRRNMDRLLNMMQKPADVHGFSLEDLDDAIETARVRDQDCTIDYSIVKYLRDCYVSENVFAKIRENPSGDDGTMLACMRDLRRYCILVEAEMMARGAIPMEEFGQLPEDLATAMRQLVPGTPEDGGHHETTYPWVVTLAQLERLSKNVQESYVRHSSARCYLEPGLTLEQHRHADQYAHDVYDLVTGEDKSLWYVLRVQDAPPAERELWPVFAREYNAKELTVIPPWAKSMYDWHGSPAKYIIRADHEAWTQNGEA